MILVKTDGQNTVITYPFSYGLLRLQHPDVVGQPITDELLAAYNCFRVTKTEEIPYDVIYEKLEEDIPVLEDGVWKQVWTTRNSTEEEIADIIEVLKQQITDLTQKRLDDFAKSGGYDNILSASTYKDSAIPRFNTEGTYCFNKRDETWITLAGIMQEVLNGTRPMPRTYADVEGDLPELVWPSS